MKHLCAGSLLSILLIACTNVQPPAVSPNSHVDTNQDKVTKFMTAATSPSGEAHPGQIENIDKIENKTWVEQASDVPQSIGWVRTNDVWVPVVRIEITRSDLRIEVTKFGKNRTLLETTVSSPPPTRKSAPLPMPTPTPTPSGD